MSVGICAVIGEEQEGRSVRSVARMPCTRDPLGSIAHAQTGSLRFLPAFRPIRAFMVIRRGTRTAKNVIIRQQADGYASGRANPISAGSRQRRAGETRHDTNVPSNHHLHDLRGFTSRQRIPATIQGIRPPHYKVPQMSRWL